MNTSDKENDIPQWKLHAERSNVSIIRFMVWLSLTFGRTLSRSIVYGIAAFYLAFGGIARHASRDYLTRILGRAPKLSEIYKHFLSFSSTIHDRIFLLRNRFELFDIRCFGFEASCTEQNNNIPILVLGAHLGSFEALRANGQKLGCDMSMLMYRENSNKLNSVFSSIALDPQPRIIALQQPNSMLLAQAHLSDGYALGMLADRRLGNDAAFTAQFLGAEATFPRNPFRLANVLRCKVYFMAGLYLGGNRYELHMVPLADFTEQQDELTPEEKNARMAKAQQDYVAQLEKFCRQAPFNWFNFFDFWNASEKHKKN